MFGFTEHKTFLYACLWWLRVINIDYGEIILAIVGWIRGLGKSGSLIDGLFIYGALASPKGKITCLDIVFRFDGKDYAYIISNKIEAQN